MQNVINIVNNIFGTLYLQLFPLRFLIKILYLFVEVALLCCCTSNALLVFFHTILLLINIIYLITFTTVLVVPGEENPRKITYIQNRNKLQQFGLQLNAARCSFQSKSTLTIRKTYVESFLMLHLKLILVLRCFQALICILKQ